MILNFILNFFSRQPKPKPARDPLPDYCPADHWPEPASLEDYIPKRPRPPVDPVMQFLVSLPREKQLKLSRLLRHAYGPQLRMAA